MEQEIWKDINGYDGFYRISNLGRVKSARYNRYLKLFFNKKGYARINLNKKGKLKTYRVHRLVAQAFIPNPNNKPQVNHKDGNKRNNCVDNLEWVTNEENYEHAIKNNLISHQEKPVALIINGKEIARYKSISEASKMTNYKCSSICYALSHSKHALKKTKAI